MSLKYMVMREWDEWEKLWETYLCEYQPRMRAYTRDYKPQPPPKMKEKRKELTGPEKTKILSDCLAQFD